MTIQTKVIQKEIGLKASPHMSLKKVKDLDVFFSLFRQTKP